MSLPLFETSTIDLSMRSSTGQQLTANVYTVEGVYNSDDSLRELSIGQLVMAVCLNRAAELEDVIVSLMESLARQSANISALTEAQTKILEYDDDATMSSVDLTLSPAVTYYTSDGAEGSASTVADLFTALAVDYSTSSTMDDLITATDSTLDSLNTISQELLIEIQSKTTKRDDTYNLISNVLKSLNTTLVGNANNL